MASEPPLLPLQPGARRYRVIPHRHEAGRAFVVSRAWEGEPAGGWQAGDDLVLMLDPALGPEVFGRWVNALRDAGHAVEAVIP